MPNQPQQQQIDVGKTLNQINELIVKNSSGIVVIPAKATPDAVAAATSIYMALIKMGKTVSLVSSEVPQSDMIGVDKIQTTLATGGKNLVVSFPYKEGAIDKVDYKIDNDRFNLIIAPREGNAKLEPKDVQFTYTGGKIEFIITIDTPNLNALGEVYQKNENQFSGKNIVNIDRHLINNNYGTINFVVKTSSSTSELVYQVLRKLGTKIDKDIATNLYTGIAMATNNFSAYSVNADTFEAVASLMRAGAVRKPMGAQFGARSAMPGMRPMPQGMGAMPVSPGMNMNPYAGAGFNPYQGQPMPMPMPMPMPQQPPMNVSPLPQPIPKQPQQPQQPQRGEQQQKAIEDVEPETSAPDGADDSSDAENWLKPRIFSGKGGLV